MANLLPQYDGGPLARAAHQRLAGFTLDETRSYIWACLRGAGCDWAEELVPEDVVLDIQAFTQGIVGDINAHLLRGARRDRGTLDGQQPAAEDHASAAEGSRRQPESALRRVGVGAARRRAVAGGRAPERTRLGCGSKPRG